MRGRQTIGKPIFSIFLNGQSTSNKGGMMAKFKVLDMPVERDDKGAFKVTKQDFQAYLEKKGINEEVRKKIETAQNEVIEESAKFLKDFVVKEKTPQMIKFGSGDNSLKVTLHGKREFPSMTNPAEKTTKFGGLTVTVNKKAPSVMRHEGGLIDQISKDIEKAWGIK